jgi:poly(3-hydroxybutyrate) depolymerase
VLGRTHPDIFAGVAAHSGLPAGVAHDMPSAFTAMHARAAPSSSAAGATGPAVPTIVFHGDADATVTAVNGAAIAGQAVAAFERNGADLQRLTRMNVVVNGSNCTATEFSDDNGNTVVEQWVVHGGAHAWFGGSPTGSFTASNGPDASAEIVRFFLNSRQP